MFKKIALFFLCFFLVAGIFVFTINLKISSYQSSVFAKASDAPTSSVALVFGAGIRPNGKLTDALSDRVLTSIELYQQGKVKKILMSGDNSTKNYDEVTAMKKFAVEKGVKEEDVALDYAGFDTYDSCYRAHKIFDLNEGVILVTQKFHLPRALYICNRLGVKSIGVIADKRIYAINAWQEREFLAKIKAGLEVEILKSKPKFLGQKEKIF